MKIKTIVQRLLLCLLCAVLLLGAVACAAPYDEGEEPPAQMRCASVAGAPYRLFLPTDWNLTTDGGLSGGYYALNTTAKVTAQLYDNAAGLTTEAFWTTVMRPELAAFFGESFTVELQSVPTSGEEEQPSQEEQGEAPLSEGDDLPEDGESAAEQTEEKSELISTMLGSLENEVNYATPAVAARYRGILNHIEYRGMAVIAAFGDQIAVVSYLAQNDVYEAHLAGMEAAVTHFRWLGTPYTPEEPLHTVDPDADAPAGMQLASNDDVAYRFYVPESWVIDQTLPTSSAYCSESDRSNVSVTVYMPEEDTLTAEQYWEMVLADLQGETPEESILRNMEVLSESEGELDGRPSRTYVYRGEVAGKSYRFSQTIAAYRGMVYTLTYTAEDAVFEQHLEELADIIEAFDFRGNE